MASDFVSRWKLARGYCEQYAPDLMWKVLYAEGLQKRAYRNAGSPLGNTDTGRLLWVGHHLASAKRRSA